MNHPIDEYLAAHDAYRTARRSDAATHIARALGGDRKTSPIEASLDTIFEKTSLLHHAVLETIIQEAKRRQKP